MLEPFCSYSLLQSSVMCLRGHRSTHRGPTTSHIEVAYSEGCLESGGRVWMLVSQLSSTLPSSAGGGGKGSPSSPGKKSLSAVGSYWGELRNLLILLLSHVIKKWWLDILVVVVGKKQHIIGSKLFIIQTYHIISDNVFIALYYFQVITCSQKSQDIIYKSATMDRTNSAWCQ